MLSKKVKKLSQQCIVYCQTKCVNKMVENQSLAVPSMFPPFKVNHLQFVVKFSYICPFDQVGKCQVQQWKCLYLLQLITITTLITNLIPDQTMFL